MLILHMPHKVCKVSWTFKTQKVLHVFKLIMQT